MIRSPLVIQSSVVLLICLVAVVPIANLSVIECNGGTVVHNECKCPSFTALDNGTCKIIQCCGGIFIYAKCYCPENTTLVDGTCTPTAGCVNGEWSPKEQRCICKDGYEQSDGVCLLNTLRTCYDAPESAYAPGTMDCDAPGCTSDEWMRNVLLPTNDPMKFWQCGPGIVHEMPCAPSTCFSYARQVCVHPIDWVNECN